MKITEIIKKEIKYFLRITKSIDSILKSISYGTLTSLCIICLYIMAESIITIISNNTHTELHHIIVMLMIILVLYLIGLTTQMILHVVETILFSIKNRGDKK